jgi:hypothetical protein
VRRYGKNVGENIGNPLGTWKEHSANTLGSWKKWKKNLFPPPPPAPRPTPKHKRKKRQGTLSACLGLPIGCMKFLFPKDFVTIFGMGYRPLQRTPHLFSVGAHLILKNNCKFFEHFRSRKLFCNRFKIQALEMTKLGW